LDLKFLGGRLYHKIAGCQPVAIEHAFNPPHSCSLVSLGDLVLCQFAVEVLADGLETAIEEPLLYFTQQHLESAACKHMSNAVAHGARTHYSHLLNIHGKLPRKPKV